MLLVRGAQGDAVKGLQRGLNKLGALLLVDGDFGAGTEAAVVEARDTLQCPGPAAADDELLAMLVATPELSPDLTGAGLSFIGREEVSSPADYRTRYRHPTWPSPNSGITIGIGYDLRFANVAKLQADWGSVLPASIIARFAPVLGTPGSDELLGKVADIEIPLPAAISVFVYRMMPEHIRNTRIAYPGVDALPPTRRTALISLVFNRGNDLEGDRRREMKQIRDLLVAGNLDPIAAQLEAMVRLWDPQTEGGIIERRRREAILWRDGFGALQLD